MNLLRPAQTAALTCFPILALTMGVTGQGKTSPRGMDQNGRIPKVPIPIELKHPERWRYFPEGRLLKGNMLDRFLVSSFFAPTVFHGEDVGTGGGITDIDFRNQRRIGQQSGCDG